MKSRLSYCCKITSIILFIILIITMATATVIEKIYDTEFVSLHIYSSPLFITAWILASISSVIYVVTRMLYRKIITFTLHISFIIILTGALVTHISGVQGYIHIRKDMSPVDTFCTFNKENVKLPFKISLQNFHIENYPGTQSPMDYISNIMITDKGSQAEGEISMNKIFEYKNYRFYQSGFDKDKNGTTLSVYHDPIGIGITYTGYFLLFLSVILFVFEKNSLFRKLLRSEYIKPLGIILLMSVSFYSPLSAKTDRPQTVPTEVADSLSNLYVYYNGRICPMQTLAYEFTTKIYGKSSYKGFTPEEVLAGWFFYYDDWKYEPFIKIKNSYVQEILGCGKYAKISDFIDNKGFKLERAIQESRNINQRRQLEESNEKFTIITMLCTGSLMKIFPVCDTTDNSCKWYSISDKIEGNIPHEKWMFMKYSMNYVSENIYKKDFAKALNIISKIRKFQIKEAGEGVPSANRFSIEKTYNSWNKVKIVSMICLAIGIPAFIYQSRLVIRQKPSRSIINRILTMGLAVVLLYTVSIIIMRGIISGHFPIANGFETMLFMASTVFLLTIIFRRYILGMTSFGYLIGGLALLVAMLVNSNPAITPLMPVLSSPLLSIHVMTIMISYSLFAIMMLNGVTAEIIHKSKHNMKYEIKKLETMSRIILYPAVLLLAAGIFIGAIWANVSWGRYWGWDPKEVWALITMLVYVSALHTASIRFFNNGIMFHRFTIIAFLTVIITYFGVNFIIGGMHSYA